MKLKTAIEIAIGCFSVNFVLSLVLRYAYSQGFASASGSIWIKNAFSFVSLLQTVLLYGPLILFLVVFHAELRKPPEKDEPPPGIPKKYPEPAESPIQETSTGKKISPIRAALLTLGFTVLGLIAILISWGILGALADSGISKGAAMRLISVAAAVTPVFLWGVIFLLTSSVTPSRRYNIRLYSAVGFFIAAAIAWIGLSPLAMLGIGFKGVRM